MSRVQQIDTPIVINPRDIDEGNPTAVRQLNQAYLQLFEQVKVLQDIVDDHDSVINGSEESENT